MSFDTSCKNSVCHGSDLHCLSVSWSLSIPGSTGLIHTDGAGPHLRDPCPHLSALYPYLGALCPRPQHPVPPPRRPVPRAHRHPDSSVLPFTPYLQALPWPLTPAPSIPRPVLAWEPAFLSHRRSPQEAPGHSGLSPLLGNECPGGRASCSSPGARVQPGRLGDTWPWTGHSVLYLLPRR